MARPTPEPIDPGRLVELARKDEDLTASHSVEEATHRHQRKRERGTTPQP